MKTVYLLLLLATPLAVNAQPETPMLSFETIGGDGSDKVMPYTTSTPDGGFIIGLNSLSSTGPITDDFCSEPHGRMIFVKYNASGSAVEWNKCFSDRWSDSSFIFLFETTDDKYVVGGMKNSGNRWIIRKEDAMGGLIWNKSYGGTGTQELNSMMATDDGGYILFGSAYSGDGDMGFHYGGGGTRDFWALKVDVDGEKVWCKIYGGTGDDIGASVVLASDGGYYIIGSTSSSDYDCTDNHGARDVFVAKINTDGNMVWHKCIGGTGSDGGAEVEGCRATNNGSGGILIAARTGSADGDVSHKINDIGNNIWLINVDSSGNILWDNCYGGGGQEYPNSICRGTDGDIWIMGSSQTVGGQVRYGCGGKDAWLVHADSDGNFLNAKVLGSSRQDVGYMVFPLSDGSVLGGGYYGYGDDVFSLYPLYGGSKDAFLAKFANWANEIHSVALNSSVSIYPNPTTDFIQIRCQGIEKGKVSISDVVGKVVYSGEFKRQLQLSVRNWHSGMYYVQVLHDNKVIDTQEITINR